MISSAALRNFRRFMAIEPKVAYDVKGGISLAHFEKGAALDADNPDSIGGNAASVAAWMKANAPDEIKELIKLLAAADPSASAASDSAWSRPTSHIHVWPQCRRRGRFAEPVVPSPAPPRLFQRRARPLQAGRTRRQSRSTVPNETPKKRLAAQLLQMTQLKSAAARARLL
jgi:hypothetical protein